MKKSRHLLLLLFYLFVNHTFAQKKIVLKEDFLFKSNNGTTGTSRQERIEGKKQALLFRNSLGIKKNDSDLTNDTYTEEFQQGVILEDGRKFTLDKNEELIAYDNDFVFAAKTHWHNYTKEIHKYQISANSLILLQSLVLSNYECSVQYGSKRLLVEDTGEGGGASKFDIYTDDFKLIATYSPFNGYYDFSVYSINEKYILLGTNPLFTQEHPEAKITLLERETGKVLKEILLETQQRIDKVQLVEDVILVNTHSSDVKNFSLTAFTTAGNHLWEQKIPKTPTNFILQTKIVYLLTSSQILSFDLKSGKQKIQRDLTEIFQTNLGSTNQLTVVEGKSLMKDKYVGLLVASPEQEKFNNTTLIILNSKLQNEGTLKIGDSSYLPVIFNTTKGFSLLQENKRSNYQINE
ncbi:hypothetical protein QNI19_07945 [Cytophagaceae bacterium DM2B3-1]|uniref:Uncharacterized protein n=1 Tax=Xanthocytophaga flava TaxID=3048013 RepID=A0ABT7CH68_9BACT|nr:hypothetical protein [Xanthocytophaga flavus]MDJ1492861.1 hypothetical protein [Xanthocytophaga flavus]